jgi:alcohol dehydrogenase (cytochrome c)
MTRIAFLRSGRTALTAVLGATAAIALLFIGGASAVSRGGYSNTNWGGFGNTPDENRYSPLDQITPSNADQLGRAFTVDLNKVVPGIKKGQQTYPVVINGTMYITSGDDQVFAVNAATGDVLWHYAPYNLAAFKNYGIVANRGVAYCDHRIYLLTLDMTIVALDPANGNQVARVPIAKAVPQANSSYGYSETSAPVCADHHLIVGAAGSEYGVRGFVMAYNTPSLTPAWPNPFWIIPPNNTEWRSAARIVGGCTNWTPQTIDLTSGTLYFGTASASPAYFPQLRPGNNPRCTSLVALDLKTGQLKWWQQQLASNQWAYDSSQPPMVYTAKVGGKSRRIVSIASMEGVWFAYDAKTGAPLWQRVKVIDNVEHPSLKPGQPVAVYPSSLGGLNYSPASFDPQTGYVYNAASETASALQQDTTAQQRRKALLEGDVWLGLSNGDFGQYLQNGWHDYGSVSAINVATGQRVWKFDTPQPERGGPTTTAGGVGFVGGGDGNVRAFDVKTGKVLWTFQTGAQIADGPSVYSVNGTEYVAIGVGGTPTSSNGGTVASQVQVFSVGGSHAQSSPPANLTSARIPLPGTSGSNGGASSSSRAVLAATRPLGTGRLTIASPVIMQPWNANSSNQQGVGGRVTLDGEPVQGAVVQIDGWTDPTPTDSNGAFTYPADDTMALRHVARVVDASHASVGGHRLRTAQQKAILGRSAGISVGYKIDKVSSKVEGGKVVVTGRLTDSAGTPAPPMLLYSYLLTGTITDANGNPVAGAVVTTRTNDRKFWTQSRPSGKNGKYASFLVPADEEGDNPVPMQVGVAVGGVSYAEPATDQVPFAELSSSTLDIQLPSTPGGVLVKSALNPQQAAGAIYDGLIVGVSASNGSVIKPIRATWPDASGRFELVLPASARGQNVVFWEADRQFFSPTHAAPGSVVNPAIYPSRVPSTAPQGLGVAKLAG